MRPRPRRSKTRLETETFETETTFLLQDLLDIMQMQADAVNRVTRKHTMQDRNLPRKQNNRQTIEHDTLQLCTI